MKFRIILPVLAFMLFFWLQPPMGSAREKADESALFPRETEVLLTINLGNFSSYCLPDDLIRKFKNFRAFNAKLQEFQKEIDFDLVNDFFSWPRGSIYAGIIRVSGHSPAAEFIFRSGDMGKLTLCKLNLRDLAHDLELYHMDKECYPQGLDELKSTTVKDLPACPAGGTYGYKVSSNARSYTLECEGNCHKEDSSEFHLFYTPERGLEVKEKVSPQAENPADNLLLVIPVAHYERALQSINKTISHLEKKERVTYSRSEYSGTTFFIPAGKIRGAFALNRNYFFMAENPEIIKLSLDCVGGRRATIQKNQRYNAYLSALPESPTVSCFVDIQDVVSNSRRPLSKDEATMEFIRNCESAGVWADIRRKNIKGECRLSFIPGRMTRSFEKINALSHKNALLDLLPSFPQNVSSYAAIDIPSFMELFGSLSLTDQKKDLSSLSRTLIEKRLGASWEGEIQPAISGRAALSFEPGELIVDTLFSQFGSEKNTQQLSRCTMNLSNIAMAVDFYAIDHRNMLPPDLSALVPNYLHEIPRCPGGGSYDFVTTGEKTYRISCQANAHKALGILGNNPFYSSTDGIGGNIPTKNEKKNLLSTIPFLLGFQVNDRVKARQIAAKFTAGHPYLSTEYKDKEIFVARAGDGAYAMAGNLLLLESGANAPAKIRKTIDAMADPKKSLLQTKSYKKFQESLSGTIVLISHDRIDWLASLGKGFLLLAGSDFRDWAKAVGEYEDSWSAISVEQRKVKLLFEVTGE